MDYSGAFYTLKFERKSSLMDVFSTQFYENSEVTCSFGPPCRLYILQGYIVFLLIY